MIESLAEFLERILARLRSFAAMLEELASKFLQGVLDFLDACVKYLEKKVRTIIDYLSKLFPALGRIARASVLLSLFYIPSVVAVVVAFSPGYASRPVGRFIGWLGFAVLWALLITAIGLGSRKK